MEKVTRDESPKNQKNKKGIAKKIFLWILIAIMTFIIGCAGWIFIDKYIRKSPAPSLFGYSQFVVVSGSMSGTIEVGDIVVTRKTNDYKIGDIVTFLAPGDSIPTTHRIVMIDGEQIHTKGDAMETADVLPITADDILGEVVSVIPKLGLLSKWVTEGGGFVYILAVVAIAVVGIVFWDMTKAKKRANALTQEGDNASQKNLSDGNLEKLQANSAKHTTDALVQNSQQKNVDVTDSNEFENQNKIVKQKKEKEDKS